MPSSPIPVDEELCKYESEAHSISAKREEVDRVNKFIEGEEMGTETNPRCVGCGAVNARFKDIPIHSKRSRS